MRRAALFFLALAATISPAAAAIQLDVVGRDCFGKSLSHPDMRVAVFDPEKAQDLIQLWREIQTLQHPLSNKDADRMIVLSDHLITVFRKTSALVRSPNKLGHQYKMRMPGRTKVFILGITETEGDLNGFAAEEFTPKDGLNRITLDYAPGGSCR